MTNQLLEIKNLKISFADKEVLHGIDIRLASGEILGIVGESGSGKSLTSLAVMGLLPKNAKVSGEIYLHQKNQKIDLTAAENSEQLRGNDMGMIFQEPMTSLNPSMKCGQQVAETVILHKKINKQQARQKVLTLFKKVKLPTPERIFDAYPHELSGGQKQRVMIAMALVCEPQLLIADEPTTALDVTVQKSILDLLKNLRDELGISIVFISHDLGVINYLCDAVVVMFRGEIVESGDVQTVFHSPQKEYTRGLIACRPRLDVRLKKLPTVSDFTQEKNIDFSEESQEEREAKHKKIYAQKPLIEVKDLSKYFDLGANWLGKNRKYVKALKKTSFELYSGETLGLVGESGSGKTTLSRTLLLLEKPTTGEIFYRGKDLAKASKSELRALRKKIQIIFQDPYSSLNPRYTIREIITEPMRIHKIGKNSKERIEKAAELLQKVDLSADALNKYPHEFSGGQRQRIGIARALALSPELIVCDESVSALDVSVQAQVLNLLNDLKKEYNFTYLFISHDLSVVKYMSDRLMVLQNGSLQEYGFADQIYQNPSTDYTRDLIDAIPES